MAEALTIRITNAAQIRQAYAKSPALMTKALSLAIRKTVFIVQGRSMINTPVLTGRLRASHYTRFKPLEGEVGTNTNYDRFVHDGTKFMQGRPYLQMALDDSAEDIQDLFTRAAQDVLNDIGKSA